MPETMTMAETDTAIVGGDMLANARMFREAAETARLNHDRPAAVRYDRAAKLSEEIAETIQGRRD